MDPRLLSAEKGELLGFLGGLNTGQELPLYRRSKFGYVSDDVSNTRVTFRGRIFEIADGAVGRPLRHVLRHQELPGEDLLHDVR